MSAILSQRLLIGWITAAVLVFMLSLYFMGGNEQSTSSVGPSSYSRSAVGYAGLADMLQKRDLPVVKSRFDSLGQVTPGGVLVIAEPLPGAKNEQIMRTLLKADNILLILPKWFGRQSESKPTWIGEATHIDPEVAAWALHLVAPKADVSDVTTTSFTLNPFNLAPNVTAPVRLIHGDRLQPIIGSADGMLLGLLRDRDRKIWVLSDPDVMSNHALAQSGNPALALAIIDHLRSGSGSIVFDETIHGFIAEPQNPFKLLFRFPFIIAVIQGVLALALLVWATVGRFGTPQPAPSSISAGRQQLLENIAKLVDTRGHRDVMIKRYVLETLRDVGRQLHAPRGLSTAALIAWLQRVALARGVTVDCGPVITEAAMLGESRVRNPAVLVRLARDIHLWKGEILDGRSGHPRDR
jgi:hypothetical protein